MSIRAVPDTVGRMSASSLNVVGQIVGYVRVSAADQNPARQLAAIGDVHRLFSEAASGKNTDRPKLAEMIAYVRAGDTVRVKSPDRLARSTRDLLDIVSRLQDKEVQVEFVDNPALNTNTPQGEFMLTILAAVAQLERATIRERQAEGIALAADQIAEARTRSGEGVPKARIARDLHVSRQTLYTALAGQGRYRRSSRS